MLKTTHRLLFAIVVAPVLLAAPPTQPTAVAQTQSQFQPGPVITIQLANIDELCSAANFQTFSSHREFIRAISLNVRLIPGADKRRAILKCAQDLEVASVEGRLPDSVKRISLGWVLMSCLTLIDLGFVDTQTCTQVRVIRDRNQIDGINAGTLAPPIETNFPPGPVITLQLANIDELCTASNFSDFQTHRDYVRALTLNIRLLPGEDKRDLILKCAQDLEIATQQGRIPDALNRLALGWVLMSCLTLFDLGIVDTRTCAEVRAIRDRNIFER